MEVFMRVLFLCLALASQVRGVGAFGAPGAPVLRPRPPHPPGQRGTSASWEAPREPREWPGWRALREEATQSEPRDCGDCSSDYERLGIVEERLDRLHRVLSEVMQAIVMTDDVKFLEKEATNLMIYNATLTKTRTPLLLRGEVLRVIDKYNM